MRGWLFLPSNFHFLFTYRREKRKTQFCSPQDLVLLFIENNKNVKIGNTILEGKKRKGKTSLLGEGVALTDGVEIRQ